MSDIIMMLHVDVTKVRITTVMFPGLVSLSILWGLCINVMKPQNHQVS